MVNPVERAMMQISTTGNWRNDSGYTLIELIVVVLLVGLMMSLTIPRFQSAMLTDDLKSTTRQIVGIIQGLRDEAIRDRKDHTLHFDLESGEYWTESDFMSQEERLLAREKARPLPEGIRVLDVWLHGEGKKMMDEASIRFSKRGYIHQSAIHLASEDGREFTLVLSPFLGKVKVLETYVDFEDI